MIEHCKANDITCVFITQPSGYQKEASEEFKEGFWMTPPDTRYTMNFESMIHISELYNSYLIDLAIKNDVHVCDLASEISPSFEHMYDDCHFNLNGARKVSEVLSQFLTPIVSSGEVSETKGLDF